MQDTTHTQTQAPSEALPQQAATSMRRDTVLKTVSDSVKPPPARPRVVTPKAIAADTLTLAIDTSPALVATDTMAPTDSLFRFKDIVITPSLASDSAAPLNIVPLFGTHHLEPESFEPRSVSRLYPDWVFFIILLMLVLFTWIRVFYMKNILQIGQAFVSMTVTNQIVRDENILVQRATIMLTILFNISAALFLYQLSTYFEWRFLFVGEGLFRFMLFALLISLVYTIKFLVLKLVGFLFDSDKPVASYIFNIFLINNMLGIGLAVMVTLMFLLPREWFPQLVTISILMISFSYIYRIMRGLAIGINSVSVSKFYLFLYLCALELGPLLILVKLIR